MTLRATFLVSFLERVLKRPITLDPNIPLAVLVTRMLSLATGLARGLIVARRRLVLEPGARISDLANLRTGGGLVRIGAYSRIECTSREGIKVGRNFKLGAFSRMIASGTLSDLGRGITIGDNVGISEFAYIGGAGGVHIGSDTIVGQYFSIHPENHVFADSDRTIREQGVTRAGVEIGPDCWIGAKVTILDGVSLGRGCVVAAGSIVNSSFPDYAIIGGVPARLLRMRKTPDEHTSSREN
ncbi:acyltransferase [Seohaeicola saemankumensis]|uniref:Acyltransferase n=1 Tax=Seohaeicola saemankumensis TaxID=481181 RepID=A0ABW3TFI9_9RHOB